MQCIRQRLMERSASAGVPVALSCGPCRRSCASHLMVSRPLSFRFRCQLSPKPLSSRVSSRICLAFEFWPEMRKMASWLAHCRSLAPSTVLWPPEVFCYCVPLIVHVPPPKNNVANNLFFKVDSGFLRRSWFLRIYFKIARNIYIKKFTYKLFFSCVPLIISIIETERLASD